MHPLKVRTTHYKIAPFESTTEEVSFEYFIYRLKVRELYYISTQLTDSELPQKQFLKELMYDAAKAVVLATTVTHYHTKKYLHFLKSE